LTEPSNESEPKSDSVFPQSSMPIDIGSVMAQRLSAMRNYRSTAQCGGSQTNVSIEPNGIPFLMFYSSFPHF
jgi:hypothetical protein